MKKLYLFIILLTLLYPCPAYSQSDSITFTGYYPAPYGAYDNIRLVPRPDYTGSCTNGTLYVNSSGDLQFCKGTTWGLVGGGGDLWLAGTNNRIYLNSPTYTKVGIGTQTPEFPLSLIGAGSIIATGGGTTLATTGVGTRLIWYSKKGTFCAGHTDGSWRDAASGANLGTYCTLLNEDTNNGFGGYYPSASMSLGYLSSSIGDNSLAAGQGTTAGQAQYGGVAFGQSSKAYGWDSGVRFTFAQGNTAQVTDSGILAIGANSIADGGYTMAFGSGAQAHGPYSLALGTNVTLGSFGNSYAQNSIGIGNNGGTSSNNTFAISGLKVGIGAVAPQFALDVENDGGIVTIGTDANTADLPSTTGSYFAWWPAKKTLLVGDYGGSVWETVNTGAMSISAGTNNKVPGSYSVAFGQNLNSSEVAGSYSVALGSNTQSQNTSSITMGYGTYASGQYSTALGYGSRASGNTAIAMSKNATAQGDRSLAIGEGITVTAAGTNSIGISLSSTANTVSQASTLAIMGGKVGIGVLAPTSTLAIAGLNSGTGTTLQIDGSGNVIKQTSSRKYKKDINPLHDDYYQILKIVPKSFFYKASNEPDIGVIAEEVDNLGLKDLVIYSKEGKPDGFKYEKLPLYLIMVVKDQQRHLKNVTSIVCQDHPEAELCK